MKNLAGIMAMAAMMGAGNEPNQQLIYKKREETPEEKKAKITKHNFSKGLKIFKIGGVEIWATNEKNAQRKYHKLSK